jgi:hypothetical protein
MAEEIGDGTLGTPIPGDGAGPSRPSRRPNATILRTLTFTQNVSAAVFSVFIPMHLASPIAAAFGGIEAADQVLVCLFQSLQSFEIHILMLAAYCTGILPPN